jgi:hypothetical protein
MKSYVAFIGFLALPGIYSQKPINDECINATVIPGNRGILTNYTTAPIEIKFVTRNELDPVTNCSYFSYDDPRGTDGVTLWFTWRPQQTGEFEFFTDGSEYTDDSTGDDSFSQGLTTIIGVFKGDSCDSLEEIGCASPFSKVRSIDLTGGEKYYIKVGMFEAFRGGKMILTVRPAPPTPVNSKCTSAIDVDATKDTSFLAEITNALVDEASFPCADIAFGLNKGLWYKFTNALSSPLSVVASTCYDQTKFDSIISVFKGSDCGLLSCVGVADDVLLSDCGLSSVYGFIAEPSTTYYILVQGFENEEGVFKLGLDLATDYFTLIDSESNQLIEPISDVVSYAGVNSKLNIQAVFGNEAAIESVQVTFDDPPRSYCEEFPPYSVFWDTEGDFFDAVPSIPIGSHTVSATAYAQAGCTGTAGTSITKDFEVVGCYVDYAIYDTVIFCPVYYLFDDTIVDPIPCDVNIQVYAYCGFSIDAIQIELRNTVTDRVVASKTEVTYPYFLFGNDGNNVFAGSIGPGSYIISTTIDGIKHAGVPFTVENACLQS